MLSRQRLVDLHPYEYEHPSDARALDLLQGTPGLDGLTRKFLDEGIERLFTIQLRGSHLRMTEAGYPELHGQLVAACEVLNLHASPDFYVMAEGSVNAMTTGLNEPVLAVTGDAVDRLSDGEMAFLLGHEIGHVKSGHVLYHLMAQVMSVASGVVADLTFGAGKLLTTPLQWALLRWSRMSELTADRAGLLACQDVDAALGVLMRISGLPEKYERPMNRDAFIQQARDFEDLDFEELNRWMKLAVNLGSDHPWTVLRCAELLDWVTSGDYQAVLDRETKGRAHVRYDGAVPFCRECGWRLRDGAKFCGSCGQELT